MKTLMDAWKWYRAARTNLLRMRRLGTHHWADESLKDASIWSDDRFKDVEASDIEMETDLAIKPLEDLGVLVLFSVFEAAVRDHLDGILRPMTGSLGHPILEHAAEKVLEGIKQGSFANQVLTPLQEQGRITVQLSDKVKQVRDYRNWVAHGKREPRDPSIVNLDAKEALAATSPIYTDTWAFSGEWGPPFFQTEEALHCKAPPTLHNCHFRPTDTAGIWTNVYNADRIGLDLIQGFAMKVAAVRLSFL